MTMNKREAADYLGLDLPSIDKLVKFEVLHPERVKGIPLFSGREIERAPSRMKKLRFIATVSPESWRRLLDDGLEYTLLSRHSARTVEVMQPGNEVLFYLTGHQKICAAARLVGVPQKKNIVWPRGVFSYLVPLKPLKIVDPQQGVDVKALASDLGFISKPRAWGMYLHGELRRVNVEDYSLLATALGDIR